METRDLVVTPIVIIIVYAVAYVIRPRVTDEVTRVYFFPALTLKIIGALTVGLIYTFYYQGGDTFNYHKYGSRIMWEAFMESADAGLKLLFSDGSDVTGIYKYSSRIVFFTDPGSYAIVRIAAIMDLLTFSTYTSTAVLFAVFSFIGMWLFFLTFYRRYAHLHRWLAVAAFFIPSVFFWGSGLLKDTITLGCLGMATYAISGIFVTKERSFGRWLLLIFSLYGLYTIKVYILLTFLPAAILWIFMTYIKSIRSIVVKGMAFPFVLVLAIGFSYFAILKAGEGNDKYSIDTLAKTAQITAYDIRYYTGRNAGSGYSLGELDGTFGSMLALAPQAINVSLFRPYIWEATNVLMVLSGLESLFFLIFFLYILIKTNIRIPRALSNPDIIFPLVFSIAFAFAVGVSTYNFGTLVRYKIPMLPFFLIVLVLIGDHSNSERKFDELDSTE